MQAAKLEPRPLKTSAILQLLQDWSKEHAEIKLLPSLHAFAEDIYSLTAGHAGLTGVCLAQLSALAERHGQLTLAAWSNFAAAKLPIILLDLGTYGRIVQDVDGLDTSALELLNEVKSCLPYNANHPTLASDAIGPCLDSVEKSMRGVDHADRSPSSLMLQLGHSRAAHI